MEKMMERLIKKAKNGDAEAFIRLMEDNKESMKRIAFAYLKREEDVADAIQDTGSATVGQVTQGMTEGAADMFQSSGTSDNTELSRYQAADQGLTVDEWDNRPLVFDINRNQFGTYGRDISVITVYVCDDSINLINQAAYLPDGTLDEELYAELLEEKAQYKKTIDTTQWRNSKLNKVLQTDYI